jgi:hypothetical protein
VGEFAAALLDGGGELVDVLSGDTVETEHDAFRPVAALGKIVLTEQEINASRPQVSSHSGSPHWAFDQALIQVRRVL